MTITKEKTSIDFTIEKYLETKNMIKQLETEVNAMKAEIILAMGNNDELTTDFHKATNKEQIKDGVDIAKLKELFPDAYCKCFKPSIFPVLRVK